MTPPPRTLRLPRSTPLPLNIDPGHIKLPLISTCTQIKLLLPHTPKKSSNTIVVIVRPTTHTDRVILTTRERWSTMGRRCLLLLRPILFQALTESVPTGIIDLRAIRRYAPILLCTGKFVQSLEGLAHWVLIATYDEVFETCALELKFDAWISAIVTCADKRRV